MNKSLQGQATQIPVDIYSKLRGTWLENVNSVKDMYTWIYSDIHIIQECCY